MLVISSRIINIAALNTTTHAQQVRVLGGLVLLPVQLVVLLLDRASTPTTRTIRPQRQHTAAGAVALIPS